MNVEEQTQIENSFNLTKNLIKKWISKENLDRNALQEFEAFDKNHLQLFNNLKNNSKNNSKNKLENLVKNNKIDARNENENENENSKLHERSDKKSKIRKKGKKKVCLNDFLT